MKQKYPEVLFRLRTKNKLSQQQVADILNIHQRTYAHYEKGENEPSIETLIKLAEFYKIPIDVLVGRYEIPE